MPFLSVLHGLRKGEITAGELAVALANKEFVFHYQPEWDLKTNRIVGVEALMRWNSPRRGHVPPMQFIPLLEKTGLIHKFTNFLFSQTLADLAELHEIDPNLFMAVNLSVIQLQETNLVDTIKKGLEKNKIKAKYLECELSESQELTEDILSNNVLEQLADLGISVSIDDFGTGYSSFVRLKQLNIQKLKIDLFFIRSLLKNKKNKAIVSSMIKLGHDLGFPVLAEGIETKRQQEWLKNNDCDYGQGFLLSQALPLPKLKVFLKKHIKK